MVSPTPMPTIGFSISPPKYYTIILFYFFCWEGRNNPPLYTTSKWELVWDCIRSSIISYLSEKKVWMKNQITFDFQYVPFLISNRRGSSNGWNNQLKREKDQNSRINTVVNKLIIPFIRQTNYSWAIIIVNYTYIHCKTSFTIEWFSFLFY